MRRLSLDCVLFDVGGTLLRVVPSVGEIYSRVACEYGVLVEPHAVQAGFQAAWKRSVARSGSREHRTSDEILRTEWFEIVKESFGEAVPRVLMAPLFDDLYQRFASAEAWTVVPGVRETLQYLRQQGLRLGVLSNWDSRLERMLDDLELGPAFDFVVASYSVGYEKPHPAIFAEALRQAGTEPGRALHVGDSYFADIAPASSLGLRTLWIASDVDRHKEGYEGPWVPALPAVPAPFWGRILTSDRGK